MRDIERGAGVGTICARTAVVMTGAVVLTVGAAGVAAADGPIATGHYWPAERVIHHVAMDDPWVFRGPTNYQVIAEPVCWSYGDRQELVAQVSAPAPDRFEGFPFDPDRLFFPVSESVTIDWTNTTTGQQGQTIAHGGSGSVLAGIPGNGRIEMHIHLRSDQPWLHAAGSTDLPFGHSEGSAHAVVDLAGKSCGS